MLYGRTIEMLPWWASNRSCISYVRFGLETLGSLRFATRGLRTAYRSLDASAVKGIPL